MPLLHLIQNIPTNSAEEAKIFNRNISFTSELWRATWVKTLFDLPSAIIH